MIEGRIAALNLYPIKGARGIAIDAARVDVAGLVADGVSDREWMLVDRDGTFVTQRELPRLALVTLAIGAACLRLDAPGQPRFELSLDPPAGEARDVRVWRAEVKGFDAGDAAAAWFTAFLGRELRLVRFDRSHLRRCNLDYVGSSGANTLFADGYPVLVIGEESLADLNARLAARRSPALPMNRFRPNLVLSGFEAYGEDHIETLETGAVALKLVKPCTRCPVTTTDQESARVGHEPLTTLASYRRDDRLAGVIFGMNAIVLRGGGVSRGEAVRATYRF